MREETLNVQDVPDFSKLVCSLSARQLAYFCRVLAMVVFEPEVGGGGGMGSGWDEGGILLVEVPAGSELQKI